MSTKINPDVFNVMNNLKPIRELYFYERSTPDLKTIEQPIHETLSKICFAYFVTFIQKNTMAIVFIAQNVNIECFPVRIRNVTIN